jgi:hypothetical protein
MSTKIAVISRELDGNLIQQREVDGYIHATAMCKACGKQLGHYLENASTKAFLEVLSLDIGFPISKLILIRKGRPAHLQGTWVHPKVAIHLAQWLSPQFAVQVTNWVFEWLTTGQNPIHADDLERISLRRQLKDQDRIYLTDQIMAYLKKQGKYSSTNPHFLFSKIHDAINLVLTGETSKQMYQRTGLKPHELLRDYFPLDKLNRYSALSICIANYIMDGYEPIDAVRLAATQALPRPFQAEPIEPVEPVKMLEKQLYERLLPPKKH